MKISLKLFPIMLLIATVACSTTQNSGKTSSSASSDSNVVLAKDLPRYIDSLSRLSVRGSEVINTSTSTISGTTAPLFVLDDIQIGRSFSQVMRLLNDNQAVSVEFLTTRRATIRYGEEGRNGVLILSRVQGG